MDERWLLLDDALSRLAEQDADAAQVAQLRLFAGLSADEAAELLGISRATAFRHWTYARAWLQARLQESKDRLN
jgi:DNA-directed RNA polymerase specialized sigma24 family protein